MSVAESIELKCVESGAVLGFSDFRDNYFEVQLNEPAFRGCVRVYQPDFWNTPVEFFAQIARDWEGWQGDRSWESLEEQLALSATCDSTGHTTLRVKIQRYTHAVWRAEGFLVLEAGQLSTIARMVEAFFTR